jgi:hypothetical protein
MLAWLPSLIVLAASGASAYDSPYDFLIPPSRNTVSVRMLQAAFAIAPHTGFIKTEPDLPTVPTTKLQIWTFLIEHPHLRRRVLFDLGIRKDFNNVSPAAFKSFVSPDGKLPFVVDKDVPEQLVGASILLQSIDALIWRLVDNQHCFELRSCLLYRRN